MPLFKGPQQIIPELEVRQKQCTEAFTSELFATDHVLKLVKEGIAFRDAYSVIAMNPEDISMQKPVENILSKTHLGGTGNLRLDVNRMRLQEYQKWHGALQQKWQRVQTEFSS